MGARQPNSKVVGAGALYVQNVFVGSAFQGDDPDPGKLCVTITIAL